jgi:ketosteroid isomerase-like protein
MKKVYFFLLFAALIIAACQPKPKPVDAAAAKESITTFLIRFQTVFMDKKFDSVANFMADDGLFCGSDPREFFSKDSILNTLKLIFADTSMSNKYTIDKRVIHLEKDGNSAVVIEQGFNKSMTPKIPFRLISHVIKAGDTWKFDFLSWNIVALNEDIDKLNKALE